MNNISQVLQYYKSTLFRAYLNESILSVWMYSNEPSRFSFTAKDLTGESPLPLRPTTYFRGQRLVCMVFLNRTTHYNSRLWNTWLFHMYFLSDFSLFFTVNIIKRGIFCLLELVKLYLPSLWVFFKRFHELLLELRVYYFSNHTKIIIFSSKLMKIFVYPLRLCFLKKNPARLTEETAVLSFREVSQTSLSKR